MSGSTRLVLRAYVVSYLLFAFLSVYSYAQNCQIQVVESIPENVTFNGTRTSLDTYETWKWLIDVASTELDLLSFYWTLIGTDVMPNPGNLAAKGEDILEKLMAKGDQIPIRIASDNTSQPGPGSNKDLEFLQKAKQVKLVSLNFTELLGGGVLHTKVWIADKKHAYVGSANMDWRSLTQVKELGILLKNCPFLVQDLTKIFETYWMVGVEKSIPKTWPDNLDTPINQNNTYNLSMDSIIYKTFIGASPPELCTPHRSRDLDAILNAINSAKKFVHIAVMDFMSILNEYSHDKPIEYWPAIENALKSVAIKKKIQIKLLVSHWQHTSQFVIKFAQSLQALNQMHGTSIQVKYFIVPPTSQDIPFSRVNHNKYLVTDSTAVIGTSNWSGDYFVYTGGVGFSIESTQTVTDGNFVAQVQDIFDRDWNSAYSHNDPTGYNLAARKESL